jgi:hypothetical protein
MKYNSVQEALADDLLFCTSVAAIMTDNFDAEWLNWEPETVEMELRVLGKQPPSPFLMDKAMAVSVLLSTNLFHVSFETFNNLVQVFNFDTAKSDLFIPASIDDVLWGCTEARILEGPEQFDNEGFSHDIARYTGTLLSQHGMTKTPSVLNFAEYDTEEMDRRDIMLASDEFIFKAYWDSHRGLLEEAEREVVTKTKTLLEQVRGLPLKNGDTSFIDNIEMPNYEKVQ